MHSHEHAGHCLTNVGGIVRDDGSLAIAILMTVLVSGIFSILMPDMPLVAGAMLRVGCLAVLFANVMKAVQE